MNMDFWVYDFIKWLLENSQETVKDKVRKFRAKNSKLTDSGLVDKIVYGEAIFSNDVGVSQKVFMTIPGIGELVANGHILPDVISLMASQIYCIIFIAALYNVDLEDEDMIARILLVLAISTGLNEVKIAVSQAGEVSAADIIEEHLDGGMVNLVRNISRSFILKFEKSNLFRKFPLIAVPVSAGLNYLNLCSAGRAAKYYFNDLYYDPAEVADIELMKYKQARSVVSLMVYMAKADNVYKEVEKDIIDLLIHNIYVPENYMDDFKKSIDSEPDWAEIKKIINLKEAKKALLIQLFLVMHFDDELHLDEARIIDEIGEKLSISKKDIKSVEKKILTLKWFNKGLAHYKNGDYKEALKSYSNTLELSPKDVDLLNKKGNVLYKMGKYKEAVKCYEKAIKIDPKNKFTWNNKGLSLFNQEKYEEALSCYDNAITSDPSYKIVWMNKGLVLYKLKRYDEAISCYDRLLQVNPQATEVKEQKEKVLKQINR